MKFGLKGKHPLPVVGDYYGIPKLSKVFWGLKHIWEQCSKVQSWSCSFRSSVQKYKGHETVLVQSLFRTHKVKYVHVWLHGLVKTNVIYFCCCIANCHGWWHWCSLNFVLAATWPLCFWILLSDATWPLYFWTLLWDATRPLYLWTLLLEQHDLCTFEHCSQMCLNPQKLLSHLECHRLQLQIKTVTLHHCMLNDIYYGGGNWSLGHFPCSLSWDNELS